MKKDFRYYKSFAFYETMPGATKFLVCWFLGVLGYQHFITKDWLGLILHYVAYLLFISIPGFLTGLIIVLLAESLGFNAGIPVIVVAASIVSCNLYCAAIIHRIMYYYFEAVEDDSEYFFEQLANKKSWPLINRLLVIIPKNLRR